MAQDIQKGYKKSKKFMFKQLCVHENLSNTKIFQIHGDLEKTFYGISKIKINQ